MRRKYNDRLLYCLEKDAQSNQRAESASLEEKGREGVLSCALLALPIDTGLDRRGRERRQIRHCGENVCGRRTAGTPEVRRTYTMQPHTNVHPPDVTIRIQIAIQVHVSSTDATT